ncbi:T9SS type A sorting domain-containing protein [Coprobacter tertius]|uniref:T9SS type A sorting domain-containing protein n=1 Tax=Coprobacter tertius TaxID=2944915 RepID=A0ABT1MED3_9BACT|nr:T9SS type A sorting domain-containing protein [Coprobacter tertius]MCP9610982.1 T9SS type A sorting domain-containing protein [Coprobacter tertius]
MKKKIFTLFICTIFAGTLFGQRLTTFTIEGAVALSPLGTLNPKNNDEKKTGTAEIIYPSTVDLTNVTASLNLPESVKLIEPAVLPTDFSQKVTGIKIQNDPNAGAANSDWAIYSIECKSLAPTEDEIDLTFPLDIDNWSSETHKGWAGTALKNSGNSTRLESDRRSIVLSFSYAPQELSYAVNGSVDSPTAELNVEESADGVNWTIIHKYDAANPIPAGKATPAEKNKSAELKQDSRFVRFVLAKKNNSNVAFTAMKVTKFLSGLNTEKDNEDGIKVYPNPVTDILNIDSDRAVSNIIVTNISGQTVMQVARPSRQISVSGLADGYYQVLIIQADGSRSVKRIVKR